MNIMKSYKKRGYAFMVMAGLATTLSLNSCTKDYPEINSDPNKIALLSSSDMPALFTKALQGAHNSYQTDQNLFADLYAQYYANTGTNFATDRYAIQHSWADAVYSNAYSQVLPQLQIVMANMDPASPEYAVCNVWW